MSARKPTTYARATLDYDPEHEAALAEAITTAIFTASMVSDCNVVAIRTGEAAAALTTVLAGILAMSPSAVRSPTSIRKITDDIHKRLRRQVAAAEHNPVMQDFLRRMFRGTDTEGNA